MCTILKKISVRVMVGGPITGATLLYQGAPLGSTFCGLGPTYEKFCWDYFATMGGSELRHLVLDFINFAQL